MRVKICGITNYQDAVLSVKFGAWALGFNFYSKSPRYIEADHARKIIQKLPRHILSVGVFVNTPRQVIEKFIKSSGIQLAQLHGDETLDDSSKVSIPVIRTIRSSLFEYEPYKNFYAVLIDAPQKNGIYGGTGKCVDWNQAKLVANACRTILAGGLTPGNINVAIKEVNPMAVDVCSGVEIKPGYKSPTKIASLFAAIHSRGALCQ